MNWMLLVFLNWPFSIPLPTPLQLTRGDLPLNCQTWLGRVYYWKNQPSRVIARPSSKSAQVQILPAAVMPIVNTGDFSFSWGSNCLGLGIQCHFLCLWTHSTLNFKAKAEEREGMGRPGHLTNGTSIGAHMVISVLLCLFNALCFRAKKIVGKRLQQFRTGCQGLPVPPLPVFSA